MENWLNISHWRHSGRLRPHEYTSYPALFILLLIVGFALTVSSTLAWTRPGPASGSVGLSGIMPGPPPKTAAVITSPTNGQSFTSSPVTVSGTCTDNTLVEIYKNDIFAGSTPCTSKDTFSLSVDLMIGKNSLIARVYNALNEPGPDSAAVTAYYSIVQAPTAGLAPLDLGGSQLLINTDAVFRGTFPEQNLAVPVSILGGVPPYALNVQWGDSSNKVVSRNNDLSFNVEHVYSKAGTYQISLQATDSQGRVAFLSVAAIVNGQPGVIGAAGASGGQKASMSKLLVLWPLYALAAAAVVSFWLGERREKRVLGGGAMIYHPQG